MSVKITKIFLTDLQYWAGNKWASLQCIDPAINSLVDLGPNSNNKIQIFPYHTGSGPIIMHEDHDPDTTYQHAIDWSSLQVYQEETQSHGFTIFGEDNGLIGNDVTSIKIRYKLECWDNAIPPNIISPNSLYYQIVRAGYPSDHITYLGMVPSGMFTPQVRIYLPGISNDMVANSSSLFTWMARNENWKLKWSRPGGINRTLVPSSVSIENTQPDTANPEYGGATVRLNLLFAAINVAHPGQHRLELQFLPNDQQSGGFHLFADDETWTAIITAYTPSMEEPLLMSFDKTLFLEISFAASQI